jgi:hypothetical protein
VSGGQDLQQWSIRAYGTDGGLALITVAIKNPRPTSPPDETVTCLYHAQTLFLR